MKQIKINANIEQLKDLTLGQIQEMTDQSKKILHEMKFFSKKVEEAEEEFDIAAFVDSIDTKIKRPRF